MNLAALLLVPILILSAAPALANLTAAQEAEWCLTRATKKIKDQSMRRGNCAQYVLSWGVKHQNELARDAIYAIACENNISRAIDYLIVCQCHNRGAQSTLRSDKSGVAQWALQRWPSLGRQCKAPEPSSRQTSTQAARQVLNAGCICQYSSGAVGAWFSHRPAEYGVMDRVFDVSAASCANLSFCERFQQPSGFNYKFYTGMVKLRPQSWAHSQNLVSGGQAWVLWGVSY